MIIVNICIKHFLTTFLNGPGISIGDCPVSLKIELNSILSQSKLVNILQPHFFLQTFVSQWSLLFLQNMDLELPWDFDHVKYGKYCTLSTEQSLAKFWSHFTNICHRLVSNIGFMFSWLLFTLASVQLIVIQIQSLSEGQYQVILLVTF